MKSFIKVWKCYKKNLRLIINNFQFIAPLHIGSTCPELSQLNTRRQNSGTPSRKSEKGLLLFFCPKWGGKTPTHPSITERRDTKCLVHTMKSRLSSAASGSLRLPPLLIRAAKSCSVNMTSK